MSFEYLISRKTLKSVVQGKKVSKPIVRIAITSIALAVIVNLITIAVVTGFQQEVRQKVSGFGSHIVIMNAGEGSIYETEPLRMEQTFLANMEKDSRIKSISPVAYKPVLFQSEKNEITYELPNRKDTTEIDQNVFGGILKGIDQNYDLDFFKKHLKKGVLPKYSADSTSAAILISARLAESLHFSVGDKVDAFFVRNLPIKRKFTICGIYETRLEEFDRKIVLADLKYVQTLNDWGIHSSIVIEDTLINGNLIIKGDISGGNGNYRCDWGEGFDGYTRFPLCPSSDTTIRLLATDHWGNMNVPVSETAIPDTSYLKVTVNQQGVEHCDFQLNEEGTLKREYLNDDGTSFKLYSDHGPVTFEILNGRGSSHAYTGGFELNLENWDELDEVVADVRRQVEFIPTANNELLQVVSVKESESDIFVWLGFLDINVLIILVLMILIGIINMGSALLVLILVRTNMIGLLKAMGATNWSIRKIFLIQAAFLIGRGMIWGNLIGLGICVLQWKFKLFKLNPDIYYLSEVPIKIQLLDWALLNVGTLLVCVTALILPSVVITRISPVKAIRFN